ncbi:unnamed protein product [Protopolystoma xenopodis]|uniref:Uncharacterized protein n=1 Tax=Protopolystoma xenopodis TaxID=117903 RepID=A0A3S5BVB7_9PLAT|nr:unnamed protein product [Protopolystoma xenopodis]
MQSLTPTPEEELSEPKLQDSPIRSSLNLYQLVALTNNTSVRKTLPQSPVDSHHNSCQSTRLGRSIGRPNRTGTLVTERTTPHQHPGIKSNLPVIAPMVRQTSRSTCKNTVRQCDSVGLHQPPRRHKESSCPCRGTANSSVGVKHGTSYLRSIPGVDNWIADFLSRETFDQGEWSLHPEVFSTDSGKAGHSGSRLNGIQHGHTGGSVAVHLAYVFPPLALLPRVIKKGRNSCSGTLLATPHLVRRAHKFISGRTIPPSRQNGSVISGTDPPPEFTMAGFNGMTLAAIILARSGVPKKAIPTLLRARKPVFPRIYHRVWRTFISWCKSKAEDPQSWDESSLLLFLQEGLEIRAGTQLTECSGISLIYPFSAAAACNAAQHQDLPTGSIEDDTSIPSYNPSLGSQYGTFCIAGATVRAIGSIPLTLLTLQVVFY